MGIHRDLGRFWTEFGFVKPRKTVRGAGSASSCPAERTLGTRYKSLKTLYFWLYFLIFFFKLPLPRKRERREREKRLRRLKVYWNTKDLSYIENFNFGKKYLFLEFFYRVK
jgi:hypothetical protein